MPRTIIESAYRVYDLYQGTQLVCVTPDPAIAYKWNLKRWGNWIKSRLHVTYAKKTSQR